MTDDYFNLDFEDNCYESCQQQFTSSRDSGLSSDDTHQKNLQIKKKNITKKYDPIYENGVLYRYEDNPELYKKMRKKLQNRESANRVRGRQKNFVQDIQQELIEMKTENQKLQMLNAKLQAENVVLKQQVEFMQNLLMQQQQSQSLQIETQPIMERDKTKNKHLAMLSAFTMILGFVLLNGSLDPKEATVSAAEVISEQGQQSFIANKLPTMPFILGSILTLWLIYTLYVAYSVFLKKKLKKKKVI